MRVCFDLIAFFCVDDCICLFANLLLCGFVDLLCVVVCGDLVALLCLLLGWVGRNGVAYYWVWIDNFVWFYLFGLLCIVLFVASFGLFCVSC